MRITALLGWELRKEEAGFNWRGTEGCKAAGRGEEEKFGPKSGEESE